MATVPFVPGVPPLIGGISPALPALILADAASILSLLSLQPVQWGLFLNGAPAITADSVVAVDFKQDWLVSDYPVEQGAFQSYDKVQLPFEFRLRYSVGSSAADRAEMLADIGDAANALTLFDAITPEVIYPSVNVTHFDYRRTSENGVGLLVVDVWCIQVRVTAQAAFTNTQQPDGANPQAIGAVQTQTPASPTIPPIN